MAEINMTPLIDVMLVLLVIFMITAPLMTARLPLDLPKADAPATPEPVTAPLALALAADGQTYLGETRVLAEAFEAALMDAGRQNPGREVHLRADRNVPYGRVAAVIALLQKAGLSRIAFVTEPGQAEIH
jgi:biopolymer transport protein ExbD/biopolymer transport protein TolR